jgi:hypothetical protein
MTKTTLKKRAARAALFVSAGRSPQDRRIAVLGGSLGATIAFEWDRCVAVIATGGKTRDQMCKKEPLARLLGSS